MITAEIFVAVPDEVFVLYNDGRVAIAIFMLYEINKEQRIFRMFIEESDWQWKTKMEN